jgi:hypothetical protein
MARKQRSGANRASNKKLAQTHPRQKSSKPVKHTFSSNESDRCDCEHVSSSDCPAHASWVWASVEYVRRKR